MKIRTTLFLAFAFSAMFSSFLAVIISNLQLQQAIDQYTQRKVLADFNEALTRLADRYVADGNWAAFKSGDVILMPFVIRTLENPTLYGLASLPQSSPDARSDNANTQRHRPRPNPLPHRHHPPQHNTEANPQRRATDQHNRPHPERRLRPPRNGFSLLDADQTLILDGRADVKSLQLPIKVDEHIVGYLEIPDKSAIFSELRSAIVQHQKHELPLLFGACLILTTVLSLSLSRRFSHPILQLGEQASALANGDYARQNKLQRRDELGDLSKRLDELSAVLNDHETRRKSWLADISHELRTPVSIFRGEIEAVLDGIRPLTRRTIEALDKDVTHLQHLIEDLYQLSDTDLGGLRYQKTDIDVSHTLHNCINKHRYQFDQKGLALSLDCQGHDATLHADESRLTQVLDNLLTNSYKYTNSPGETQVVLIADKHKVYIAVSDTPPGVSDSELPKLFDHLYRAEQSRNKHRGGSGLGLAICQHIIDAHQGKIHAKHSPIGGITVEIHLPR